MKFFKKKIKSLKNKIEKNTTDKVKDGLGSYLDNEVTNEWVKNMLDDEKNKKDDKGKIMRND